jgi:GTPase SAR1 family protein
MEKLIDKNSDMSVERHISLVLNLIKNYGQGFKNVYTDLFNLRDRLNEGKFHLAVLGQFKRGKSTLLNAILGENILPGSVLPATAIPTYISAGEQRSVRIIFNDESNSDFTSENVSEINHYLNDHISEDKNPVNKLGVKTVELFTPSPVLHHGLVLIDTPGIGSTHLHNTEATMAFLKDCDAAVFIFSPDPPITWAEIEFLQEVRQNLKKIIFVLNKSDYLPENDIEDVKKFILNVLHEKCGFPADSLFFTVSAKNGLISSVTNDRDLRNSSGMNELIEYISDFLVEEKDAVFSTAVSLKAADFVSEIIMRLNLSVRALELPIDDLESRMILFRKKIDSAIEQKIETGDILKGDRNRLLKTLNEQSELLKKKSLNLLNDIIEKHINHSEKLSENIVSAEFAESIPLFFDHELREMSEYFSKLVSERMSVHEGRNANLIEEIKKAASEIFEIPYTAGSSCNEMVVTKKPYWVKHSWNSSFIPLPENFIDSIVPGKIRTRRIKARLTRQAGDLSMANVENLSWVTLLNLDETFRKFTTEFDKKLHDVIHATEGALLETIRRSVEHRQGTSEELKKIKQDIESLSAVLYGLKKHSL